MIAQPTVSIIIPVFNERVYIRGCLQSVTNQSYPSVVEILVIDGGSTDGTRDIVQEYSMRDQRVVLVENPDRKTAWALNRGILAARGELIVRADGHSVLDQEYVSECVQALLETRSTNVGGQLTFLGDEGWQRLIGVANRSPFGSGGAAYRTASSAGFVDTVFLGTFWREELIRIGMYDTGMVYCEDDELNFRIRALGGVVYLTPRAKVGYYPRSSLSALARQYWNYGQGKVRSTRKHRHVTSIRQLIPPLFVLFLIFLLIGSCFARWIAWFGAAFLTFYWTVGAVFYISESRERSIRHVLLGPLVFLCMHVPYGVGYIAGWVMAALRPDS